MSQEDGHAGKKDRVEARKKVGGHAYEAKASRGPVVSITTHDEVEVSGKDDRSRRSTSPRDVRLAPRRSNRTKRGSAAAPSREAPSGSSDSQSLSRSSSPCPRDILEPTRSQLGRRSTVRGCLSIPRLEGGENNVKVAVRVRPFIAEEYSDTTKPPVLCVSMPTTQTLDIHDGGDNKSFTFDRTYWSHDAKHELYATQATLHDELGKWMLANIMSGYNTCLFAYGQSGSGKSYSVLGDRVGDGRGLLPRIVEGLFDHFEAGQGQVVDNTVVGECIVSFMEIYNEHVRDLLGQGHRNPHESLQIHLHPTLGTVVEDLTEKKATSKDAVFKLIDYGLERRSVGATDLNSNSSRSHCIFTIRVNQSHAHLVDLAGSERADRSNAEGARLLEGANINKSLTTLSRVIRSLTSDKKGVVPPFRDSKLTFVLKDSLCGNSKTVMIAALSPSLRDYNETMSTLRFCQSVKKVRVEAVQAIQRVDPDGALHHETRLNESLRSDLNMLRAEVCGTKWLKTIEAGKSAKYLEQLRLEVSRSERVQHEHEETSRALSEARYFIGILEGQLAKAQTELVDDKARETQRSRMVQQEATDAEVLLRRSSEEYTRELATVQAELKTFEGRLKDEAAAKRALYLELKEHSRQLDVSRAQRVTLLSSLDEASDNSRSLIAAREEIVETQCAFRKQGEHIREQSLEYSLQVEALHSKLVVQEETLSKAREVEVKLNELAAEQAALIIEERQELDEAQSSMEMQVEESKIQLGIAERIRAELIERAREDTFAVESEMHTRAAENIRKVATLRAETDAIVKSLETAHADERTLRGELEYYARELDVARGHVVTLSFELESSSRDEVSQYARLLNSERDEIAKAQSSMREQNDQRSRQRLEYNSQLEALHANLVAMEAAAVESGKVELNLQEETREQTHSLNAARQEVVGARDWMHEQVAEAKQQLDAKERISAEHIEKAHQDIQDVTLALHEQSEEHARQLVNVRTELSAVETTLTQTVAAERAVRLEAEGYARELEVVRFSTINSSSTETCVQSLSLGEEEFHSQLSSEAHEELKHCRSAIGEEVEHLREQVSEHALQVEVAHAELGSLEAILKRSRETEAKVSEDTEEAASSLKKACQDGAMTTVPMLRAQVLDTAGKTIDIAKFAEFAERDEAQKLHLRARGEDKTSVTHLEGAGVKAHMVQLARGVEGSDRFISQTSDAYTLAEVNSTSAAVTLETQLSCEVAIVREQKLEIDRLTEASVAEEMKSLEAQERMASELLECRRFMELMRKEVETIRAQEIVELAGSHVAGSRSSTLCPQAFDDFSPRTSVTPGTPSSALPQGHSDVRIEVLAIAGAPGELDEEQPEAEEAGYWQGSSASSSLGGWPQHRAMGSAATRFSREHRQTIAGLVASTFREIVEPILETPRDTVFHYYAVELAYGEQHWRTPKLDVTETSSEVHLFRNGGECTFDFIGDCDLWVKLYGFLADGTEAFVGSGSNPVRSGFLVPKRADVLLFTNKGSSAGMVSVRYRLRKHSQDDPTAQYASCGGVGVFLQQGCI